MSVIEDQVEQGSDRASTAASRADLMAAKRSVRQSRARERRRRLVHRTIVPLCVLVAGAAVAVELASGSGAPRRAVPSNAARRTVAGGGVPPATASASPAPVTRAGSGVGAGPGAPLPVPTTAAPLHILVVGDGLAADVGQQLTTELAPGRLAVVTVDARPGTGLTRTAPLDWMSTLVNDLGRVHPALVVVVLGSNDDQSIATSTGTASAGSTAWLVAYEARARQFGQEAIATQARVLWVGMPPMASATSTTAMREIDGVLQDVAVTTPGSAYLASWPVLASSTGQFTSTLRGASGALTTVRTADGERLTAAGALLVSRAVVGAIDADWHLSLRP